MNDLTKPSPLAAFERALWLANAFITSSLLFFLTLDVLWGVGTRFLLGDQASWTEELARLLLVWVALLGGALAYSANAHLGLDLLVDRMDPVVALWCQRFAALTVYIFALAVMVIGGGMLYAERLQFGQTMPALGISRSWQYLAGPVGGVLICIAAVREIMEPTQRVTSTAGESIEPSNAFSTPGENA